MANARNRQRRQGRRPPFRDPKPTILVVSEGEVTEPEYIRGLQSACRNPRVTIEVAEEHGVPRTLVRIAKAVQGGGESKRPPAKRTTISPTIPSGAFST